MTNKYKCDKCGKEKRLRHMAWFGNKLLCADCRPDKIGVYGKRK